jgi:hypothetical protein
MVADGPGVVPMRGRQVSLAKPPAMVAAAAASCTGANPPARAPQRASDACNGLYGGAGPPGARRKRRRLVELANGDPGLGRLGDGRVSADGPSNP